MSKFCTNCGTRTEDDALFCPECGTRFEEQAWQPQQENLYQQPVEQPQENPYVQPAQQTTQPTPPPQPVQPQQNYYQPNVNQPYGQNQYYAQPVQMPPQPAPRQKKPGKGFGIASLVLGIAAAVGCLVLLLLNLATVVINESGGANEKYAAFGLSIALTVCASVISFFALLSLIFGIVSFVKGNKGTAIAGLVLTGIAIVVCVFSFINAANMKKPTWSEIINEMESENSSSLQSSLDELEDILDKYD